MITSSQPLISSLSDFTPVSEHTISEVIRKAKANTCQLDPYLNRCLEEQLFCPEEQLFCLEEQLFCLEEQLYLS